MTGHTLHETASAMVASGKGILAADESTGTMTKRLSGVGADSTEENRQWFRETLFTAPGASDFVSGVILYDETIRQSDSSGKSLAQILSDQGILPGIKVDMGAKALAGHDGEKVTEGLDGLRERLSEYATLGARFAKWRAVITIGNGIPSDACLSVNAHALARYAALCQEAGIVPIVEPEVLMDGDHTLERCYEVTQRTHGFVFDEINRQGISLEGMVLKPNMIVAGSDCADQPGPDAVADATVECFRRTVPAAVPGIVFLSGGQSEEDATLHLNEMNARHKDLPWQLSFSYGRALQASALKAWSGNNDHLSQTQGAYMHRAKMNSLARTGAYKAEMEKVPS